MLPTNRDGIIPLLALRPAPCQSVPSPWNTWLQAASISRAMWSTPQDTWHDRQRCHISISRFTAQRNAREPRSDISRMEMAVSASGLTPCDWFSTPQASSTRSRYHGAVNVEHADQTRRCYHTRSMMGTWISGRPNLPRRRHRPSGFGPVMSTSVHAGSRPSPAPTWPSSYQRVHAGSSRLR